MNFRLISKKTPDVISILSFVIFFILSCDSSESIQPLEQNKVDPFIQNKKIAKKGYQKFIIAKIVAG